MHTETRTWEWRRKKSIQKFNIKRLPPCSSPLAAPPPALNLRRQRSAIRTNLFNCNNGVCTARALSVYVYYYMMLWAVSSSLVFAVLLMFTTFHLGKSALSASSPHIHIFTDRNFAFNNCTRPLSYHIHSLLYHCLPPPPTLCISSLPCLAASHTKPSLILNLL